MAVTLVLVNCSHSPRYQLRKKQMLLVGVSILFTEAEMLLASAPSSGSGSFPRPCFPASRRDVQSTADASSGAIFK